MGGADLIVFKKKGRDFEAKITKGMHNGHTPENCHIKVNLHNYKDLALFLSDLKFLWNAPLDKAIGEYHKGEEDQFDFLN